MKKTRKNAGFTLMELICTMPEHKQYGPVLRKKLRPALRKARAAGIIPFERRFYWAYEDAWPCKVFWWLMSKVR